MVRQKYSQTHINLQRIPEGDAVKKAQARNFNAQVEMREMDLDQRAANLVEIDFVRLCFTEEIVNIREISLRLPVILRIRLPTVHRDFNAGKIQREVKNLLEALVSHIDVMVDEGFRRRLGKGIHAAIDNASAATIRPW